MTLMPIFPIYNLPAPFEVNELNPAMADLAEFESTTKLLQDQQRSLSELRVIFNAMLSKYPEFKAYFRVRRNCSFPRF
jgi:hypothetical protein